ncbi:MAG: DMSO reductase anchor subunit [Gammaproteobacteria bacterium]|jgi:DMSO reductase anchor subunit
MKPAFSVIFLTTLIGAGQGLFLAYFSVEIFYVLSILPDRLVDADALTAAVLCLLLLVAGLAASFFHLGHPERAWRAAAMWRTSWLSREVIALPLTMAAVFAYAALKYTGNSSIVFELTSGRSVELATLVGLFASASIFGLFICTAMIYSSLKFLRQWHSPLTVLNFFLMGCASGFTLAAVLSVINDDGFFGYFSGASVFFGVVALASRYASLLRNKNLRSPSTLQSAIGVRHPNIRQLAQGAMGGSFNTRAFIHSYGASVVLLARRYFLLAGFILPVLLMIASGPSSLLLCALALALQYSGLLVERWYFFIEAEHPQNVYYQMIS